MKRRMPKYFVSVCAGVILTVLSSWLCAALVDMNSETIRVATKRYSAAEFQWPASSPDAWRNESNRDMSNPGVTHDVGIAVWRARTTDELHVFSRRELNRTTWGLPLPAMFCDDAGAFNMHAFPEESAYPVAFPASGLTFYGFAPGSKEIGYVRARIPIVPWWPGFLLNTIFWSLIVAWIARLFRFARWGKYLSRGQCPKCKYPIGAKPVCPECGVAVPGGLVRPAGEVP